MTAARVYCEGRYCGAPGADRVGADGRPRCGPCLARELERELRWREAAAEWIRAADTGRLGKWCSRETARVSARTCAALELSRMRGDAMRAGTPERAPNPLHLPGAELEQWARGFLREMRAAVVLPLGNTESAKTLGPSGR